MQNLFIFLTAIFLYFYCFILNNEFAWNHNVVLEQKQEISSAIAKEHTKANKETPKNSSFELNRAKKFTYPHFLKVGAITLYVNNPTEYDYPSNSTRTPACVFLKNAIKNADKSIDFSVYGIDGQNDIIEALKEAAQRGVNIRAVVDSSAQNIPKYEDILKLQPFASVKYDGSDDLMHNKFFIIDDKFVMTGSMNISKTGCGGYNANSVAVVEDKKIISAYKKEFEQMFNGVFKKKKANYSTPILNSDSEVRLSAHFLPVDNVFEKLISEEIRNAKSEIRLSIFVFTYKSLVSELMDANNRGVKIKIITDALGASKNKKLITNLREAGIKVKVENWGGKDHEKTISIDNKTLIMGSANFSYSGFFKNDENILCIKNERLVSFYNGFFDKMFQSLDDVYLSRFPGAESFESGNSCYDGIDNNFDGNIDSYDNGCKK